ncbi:hypothetical protein [Winogradskyella sp.]|uniref:hypothetical protein n=1 Tax=Winogradskyella sp. TaxID=1883156 RepID=UPI003F6CEDD2
MLTFSEYFDVNINQHIKDMKPKITLFFFLILLSISYSQNPFSELVHGKYTNNPSETPCLTAEQRHEVE